MVRKEAYENKTNSTQNTSLSVNRNQILSLDMATHCGYYSTASSGTWDFTQKKGRNAHEQHLMFYDQLVDFILKNGIKQVVAEDINVKGQFIGMRKLAEFRGILFLVCAQLGLPEPKFVNVSTVKKWATGDGKADKKKMIDFCINRWGITPVDDNMADAVHIFKYYTRIYNIK